MGPFHHSMVQFSTLLEIRLIKNVEEIVNNNIIIFRDVYNFSRGVIVRKPKNVKVVKMYNISAMIIGFFREYHIPYGHYTNSEWPRKNSVARHKQEPDSDLVNFGILQQLCCLNMRYYVTMITRSGRDEGQYY